jgi:phage terminase large subunit
LSVLQVKTSELFERNYTAPTRIVVNQGGSRSGKTYSLLQMLIVMAMQEKGKVYSIVRKSLPSLKMTAYRDFFEILRNLDHAITRATTPTR